MQRTHLSRRGFLRATAAGAATAALSRLSASSYGQIAGANADLRMAVVGMNGRGRNLIQMAQALQGVRLVALCDVDSAVLDRGVQLAGSGPNPATVTRYIDYRKLLESKDVDAVAVATPNHWHALQTIWGCQAGKDVYMEKPVCHEVWEGRQSVAASRKYNRIVGAGTQWRTMPEVFEAIEYAKSGKLGKILVSRGLCYKPRPSIGKTTGPQAVPSTVDYDLWCGPASNGPLRRSKLHYDWHWQWDTGNGDIGNQGAHQMDLARWALSADAVAPTVVTVGGRFGYVDDGETPNTVVSIHNYGSALLIFEVRGLPVKSGAGNQMDKYKGADIGNVIECENGYVSIIQRESAAYDRDGKQITVFKGTGVDRDRNIMENFVKAVRSRKRDGQLAEIGEAVVSSSLCHFSNISYRAGKQADPDQVKAAFAAQPAAAETLQRATAHLEANGIKLDTERWQLGMPLTVEPMSMTIQGNPEASRMLRRQAYRAPYVVPENV